METPMQRFENVSLYTGPEQSWLLTNGFDVSAESFFAEVFSKEAGGDWRLAGSFYIGDQQEADRWFAGLPGEGVAIEHGDFILPEPIRPERPAPITSPAIRRGAASSAYGISGRVRGLLRPGRR